MWKNLAARSLHALRAPSLLAPSRRQLFIQVASTPNPSSLKFMPGKELLANGASADFGSIKSAQQSPLARTLFSVEGVKRVFIGSDFVAVTIDDDTQWNLTKPDVFAKIEDFFASSEPVILEEGQVGLNEDTRILDEDDDAVALIKELIETRIRPYIQEDGGDVIYRGFEKGTVRLQLQGSCVGCPSSSSTLKGGIESMLMHYVPEVKAVEEYTDEELEAASLRQLNELETRLKSAAGNSEPNDPSSSSNTK